MSWGHVDDELVRLHDGLLDDDAAARVRAHVARCERCRELDTAIAFSRGLLTRLPAAQARPKDVAAMRRALQRVPPARKRWRVARTFSLAAAAAVAAVIVGWMLTPHVRFVPAPEVARPIERVARDEDPYSTASIDAARRLVRAHTGIEPRFRMTSGSVKIRSTSIGATPVSAIVFDIGHQPVTLVMGQEARLPGAPPSSFLAKRLEVRRGPRERVFTWSASGDAYSMIVPAGVVAADACAICHQGTRTLSYIRKATRGL